jgi:triosephosphate isomerase
VLRGGAYKPRTSPYSFQGTRERGLEIAGARQTRDRARVVTEVLDPRDVGAVAKSPTCCRSARATWRTRRCSRKSAAAQAGAAQARFRGHAARVLPRGRVRARRRQPQVVLCERGIRGFDPSTRNVLDVGAVAALKRQTHLPVIVDPSHAAGPRRPRARARARGHRRRRRRRDVDVHTAPAEAHCDGHQAISLEEFARIVSRRARPRRPRRAAGCLAHGDPSLKRKPFLAGNWKMNLDRKASVELARGLRDALAGLKTIATSRSSRRLCTWTRSCGRSRARPIKVGAQNLCDEKNGAFTGEISAEMLVDVGAKLVLVGHSERRHLYGESDELCNRKVQRALSVGLDVVLCVGEKLDERDGGARSRSSAASSTRASPACPRSSMGKLTIAYEPVWAIGTGRNATPEQAGAAHTYLRGVLCGPVRRRHRRRGAHPVRRQRQAGQHLDPDERARCRRRARRRRFPQGRFVPRNRPLQVHCFDRVPSPRRSRMPILTVLCYILFVLAAIVLIVVVLLQEGRGGGFGEALGVHGRETFGAGLQGHQHVHGLDGGGVPRDRARDPLHERQERGRGGARERPERARPGDAERRRRRCAGARRLRRRPTRSDRDEPGASPRPVPAHERDAGGPLPALVGPPQRTVTSSARCCSRTRASRAARARRRGAHRGHADIVVGPAMGAVVWAHEVARALGLRSYFTERVNEKFALRRGFSLEARPAGAGRRGRADHRRQLPRGVRGRAQLRCDSRRRRVDRQPLRPANPFEQDGVPFTCLAEVDAQSWMPRNARCARPAPTVPRSSPAAVPALSSRARPKCAR